VRNSVIARGRASTVLRGAALKAYGGSEKQRLLLDLNRLIISKQNNGSKNGSEVNAKSKIDSPSDRGENKLPRQFTADELNEGFEGSSTFKELSRTFKILQLSNRVRRSKGKSVPTSVGHSGLDEVNEEVNQELLNTYLSQFAILDEARVNREKAKEEQIKFLKAEKKAKEERIRQIQEEKAVKEAAMPGIFKEIELSGCELRLYIGYSKKSKRVLRVDDILSGKPGLAKGATFEVGSIGMPKILKGINEHHLELTFKKLDEDLKAPEQIQRIA